MLFSFFLLLTLGLFTWLSIRHFHSALLLFLALFPTYLIRFSLGPLPTTLLELCFFVLFGVWVVRRLRAHTLFLPSRGILVFFFLLSILPLAVVPGEHLLSSLGLWRAYFLEPFLLGWILWHELQDETIRLRAFLSLSLSGFFLAALGIFQFSTGLGIPAPWDIERRITSVFDYPNALGLFLAPLLSALLVFGICTWKNRLPHEKTFLAGACTVMLLAIILAKTEAALVAVPAAVFISLFISPLILRKHKIIAGVFASLALVGAFAFPHIRAKLLLQDFSGGVRLSQWKETIELLKDHPITGAGIGYYPELLRTSYHHDWQYEIFQYPHNILLNIWVELGILGVVLFLVGACYLGRSVWKQRSSPLPLAAGAALLAMAIHGLVDVPFFKNDLAMMTVLFVVLCMGRRDEMGGGSKGSEGSEGSGR